MNEKEYNDYKVGALKRKFKLGKGEVVPGTFIKLMNDQKASAKKYQSADVVDMPPKKRTAYMGMI